MNKKELQKYEAILLDERKRFITELAQIKSEGLMASQKESAGDLSSASYHPADQGSDTMEKEKSVFLASSKGNELYEIDQALMRAKDGKFGICDSCGKEVDPARLEAMPYARYCIKCSRQAEQLAKNGNKEQ
ncbi:TraR/DksA C4-type zinc finger protein [candidate division TA06 bacterium]|uniref:TraR/DksA C4-type zinc finger protein n=1 Tax=candidate division TA06 bacterium TaxID=2250710 RepID=A0A933IAD3_UNCT6|nr:TraR/DksA C4-type zinc finger protein [candidate division TA06 bacterium]